MRTCEIANNYQESFIGRKSNSTKFNSYNQKQAKHKTKKTKNNISGEDYEYGAWSRHNGSVQLVWCTDLPVLIAQMFYFILDFFV